MTLVGLPFQLPIHIVLFPGIVQSLPLSFFNIEFDLSGKWTRCFNICE